MRLDRRRGEEGAGKGEAERGAPAPAFTLPTADRWSQRPKDDGMGGEKAEKLLSVSLIIEMLIDIWRQLVVKGGCSKI